MKVWQNLVIITPCQKGHINQVKLNAEENSAFEPEWQPLVDLRFYKGEEEKAAMLSRDNRLTDKKDFDNLKEKGKIVQSNSFALAFFKRPDSEASRFGFVVSTKISKLSTERNKAKRALREAVRQSLSYIIKGYDCAFLARPQITKKYTDEIMREVKEALMQAQILQ